MNCEYCGNEHNGTYGSGRFCSNKCAKGFSTKDKREEISKKISKFLTKDPYIKICPECNKEFKTKRKEKKFCSRSCNTIYYNKKTKHSGETKNRISKSVLQNYKEGKQVYGGTTKWFDYGKYRVQGTYELRTCQILDIWKEYNIIRDWEYTNERVEYLDKKGKRRTYLLDFKVLTNEGFTYYIEVKGYQTENDTLKWKAVRERGDKLEIWFEKDIIKIENGLAGVRG